MPKNASSLIDVTNVSANQMFVVDVNLENAPSSSFASSLRGGGTLEEYPKRVKRLTIGKNLENDNENENMKLMIINNKKKTRRRYK